MVKYILGMLVSTLILWSCPFDEAKVEVTIVAQKSIMSAVKSGDFIKAQQEITKNKKLYTYFEKTDKKPLFQPLLSAAKTKDAVKIKKLLDHSLVLEIKELLGQAEENFGKYQKTRLLLIKAKKHLKALTKEKIPMKYMKKTLKSIGNPGLMGVGKREPNKAQFLENKELLLTNISAQ